MAKIRKTSQQMFDAPIPGQSLTGKLGSKPWENPPQYTNVDTAAEAIWASMQVPSSAIRAKVMLEQGFPAEGLANNLLMGGFTQGKWGVDVMTLLEPIVIAQVATIGSMQGLAKEDIKIMWEDDSLPKFLAEHQRDTPQVDEGTVSMQNELSRGPTKEQLATSLAIEDSVIAGKPDKPFKGVLADRTVGDTPQVDEGTVSMQNELSRGPTKEQLDASNRLDVNLNKGAR